jgi:ATP-dependent Lon protease
MMEAYMHSIGKDPTFDGLTEEENEEFDKLVLDSVKDISSEAGIENMDRKTKEEMFNLVIENYKRERGMRSQRRAEADVLDKLIEKIKEKTGEIISRRSFLGKLKNVATLLIGKGKPNFKKGVMNTIDLIHIDLGKITERERIGKLKKSINDMQYTTIEGKTRRLTKPLIDVIGRYIQELEKS